MTLNNGHNLIEMRDLTRVYQLGAEEIHALRGIDMVVGQGEYVAIMGPSGSGKSTLMNIMGCLDQPTRGSYVLDGRDVARLSKAELADVRDKMIGFVFQSFNLLSRTTALENVEMPLMYQGIPARERRRRAMVALDRVGLAPRADHHPNQLSGGQQQRVAIARALAGSPRLLLADEPTGNLDSLMARGVMELLEEINRQGTTIVMVTHDPELAARASRNIHIMDGQVMVLDDEPRLRDPVAQAGGAAHFA